MTDTPNAAEQSVALNLEGRLRRLEEIVGALESEELELDRALELFEEGVSHVRQAEEVLAEAEVKVQELIGDGVDSEVRDFPTEEQGS